MSEGDYDLINSCLKGNRNSYNLLYEKYAGRMFNVCMRYANSREEAEDLLQESFITSFSKLNQFQMLGSFEGWLRRITINTCLLSYRDKYNSLSVHIDDEYFSETIAEEINVLHQMEAADLIKLIQKLPSGCKAVLNAYAIDGCSHKEISEMLGISIGTSKSQLFDARKMLRKMLNTDTITKKAYNEK